MAKKIDDLSMWERSEYDVISETETENGLVAVLKVRRSGAAVICNIPRHTPGEEEKLAENVTEAMIQIVCTGQDISHFRSMEILTDQGRE
ncbi:MAG: hypothetical protein J6K77_08935 [Ruminococcus sp.]|nr:hypothetical protein [Ruminococcus sp.]